MKLLVVEDELPTLAFLRRGLTEEGFAVDVAENAGEADAQIDVYNYDAILLDVMLPGGSGFDLCRRWRAGGLQTPILFLSAREAVPDRVHGLSIGGDDYLVKPFAFEELLARVRVLVRRGQAAAGAVLRVGDVEVDTEKKRVTCRGQTIVLTAREYQILEYLAYNAGKVISRTQLWEHVWESYQEPDSNVVDVYVRYLRNKLGRDVNRIETVRGLGYVLHSEVQE